MNEINLRRPVFTNMADGSEGCLHLHEVVGGQGDGPTIGISAVIHGNEPTGAQIILELSRLLADLPLRGRLLILPVANPWAFAVNHRFTPIDELNLNRVFPGEPGGWFSDLLAQAISREFLEKIDVHIDLHSGTDRPTVDYVYLLNDEGLSRSFGSTVLYRPKEGLTGTTYSGTTKSVTVDKRGIPASVIELGGGIVDQAPYVKRGVDGVLNMLRYLGAIVEDPAPPPSQTVVHSITLVRPGQGGFLETEAPPLGEEIAGGAVLGRVFSPYTFDQLEEIINPVEQGIMILSHLSRNLVQPGDYGYMIGDLAGAELS
ncbi:MAG: succinylglutamate desuccinylase/aspartoacylase family protein [Pseudomonadota bacterium]